MLIRFQFASRIRVEILQAVLPDYAVAEIGSPSLLTPFSVILARATDLLILVDDILQADAVSDQQSDLDVHLVQTFFQLSVEFDHFDDFVLDSLHFDFLLEVGSVVVQQMDEFPQHSQIQLRLVFEDVIISPDFASSKPRLDLDDVLEMPLIKGLAVLKRDLRRDFAPPSLDLDEAADVSLVVLHSVGASAS